MPELLDIVGQDRAIAQLERALNSHRVPHSFIFAGPDGVGRRTTAVAMARLLLCEKPVSVPRGKLAAGSLADVPPDVPLLQACGHCADCRMMQSLSHPDFHLVYKELARYHEDSDVRGRVMQDLGIDVIRSFLIEIAGRISSRGRGKVFVVLQSDLMSEAAQNALLKTLEEPPPGVTIILICEQPGQLLPTTLSRCRVIPFGLLPAKWVVGELARQGLSDAEALFWARYTDGSVGRALELSRAQVYEVKKDLVGRLANMGPSGDADLGEHIHKVTEDLASAAIHATKQEQGADLAKSLATRQSAGVMLELIASAFLDAMHLRAALDAGKPAPPLIHADQERHVQVLAQRFEAGQLAEIIEQLHEYEQLLWRNVNAKTVWENVVITCATAAPLRVG